MSPTWIGPDVEFDGVLKARDLVEIEGKVSGHISSEGTILVNPKGRFEGLVEADELVVEGHVWGELKIVRQLEIQENGEVYSELESPPERLILWEKAKVGGTKTTKKGT